MADSSPGSRFADRFLGAVYGLMHATVRRGFKGWLVNLPLFLAVFMLLLRWPIAWPIGLLVLDLVLRLLYWKARRDGYVRLVAAADQKPEESTPAAADNQKVKIKATGIFSVKNWEEYMLTRPAEYWRVPLGDQTIMVQHSPGRFLYQFLRAGSIETVEAGLLCHSTRSQMALAVTYLTSWGPESDDANFMFYAPSDESNPSRQKRKMFLTFEDEATRDSVWKNLMQNSD